MSLQVSTFAVAIPFSVATTLRRHRNIFTVRAQVEPSDKNVEIMRKFSEQYARKSGTYFCVDKGVTSVVIKGLADHKDSLGAPLCPCRHYDDKAAEASQGFWNCPCVPMKERLDAVRTSVSAASPFSEGILFVAENPGATDGDSAGDIFVKRVRPNTTICMDFRKECHCMLFLTPDNDFAGQEQTITLEEIKESTANM